MPETPDQEWRRLTKLYGEMYDGQLLELAASLNDLTEMGKTVLRDELRKRGLGDPMAPGWSAEQKMMIDEHEREALEAAEADAAGQPDTYTEYSWKVEVGGFDSREEAIQRNEQLRRAGVESWLRASADQGSYRLLVAADQVEEARAVFETPIPQDIIDESRIEIPEYAPPVCPSCGAADPVLLSADPTNSWECEACGNEWSEPIDERAQA